MTEPIVHGASAVTQGWGSPSDARDFGALAARMVEFTIAWESFDNDDLADDDDPNPEPDEGWYIDGKLPDGMGFDLGPDAFGPGLPTVDAALALIAKWAKDRGYRYARPLITVNLLPEEAHRG